MPAQIRQSSGSPAHAAAASVIRPTTAPGSCTCCGSCAANVCRAHSLSSFPQAQLKGDARQLCGSLETKECCNVPRLKHEQIPMQAAAVLAAWSVMLPRSTRNLIGRDVGPLLLLLLMLPLCTEILCKQPHLICSAQAGAHSRVLTNISLPRPLPNLGSVEDSDSSTICNDEGPDHWVGRPGWSASQGSSPSRDRSRASRNWTNPCGQPCRAEAWLASLPDAAAGAACLQLQPTPAWQELALAPAENCMGDCRMQTMQGLLEAAMRLASPSGSGCGPLLQPYHDGAAAEGMCSLACLLKLPSQVPAQQLGERGS